MRFHELPLPLLFVIHASASLDRRAISYQSLTSMYDSVEWVPRAMTSMRRHRPSLVVD